MSKRKSTATAEETAAHTDDELVNVTAEPPKPNPAPENAATAPERQPGDDTKSWVNQTTASVIVDPEAGVKFHFDYDRDKATIIFDEKPAAETLDQVKPILKEGLHVTAPVRPTQLPT